MAGSDDRACRGVATNGPDCGTGGRTFSLGVLVLLLLILLRFRGLLGLRLLLGLGRWRCRRLCLRRHSGYHCSRHGEYQPKG